MDKNPEAGPAVIDALSTHWGLCSLKYLSIKECNIVIGHLSKLSLSPFFSRGGRVDLSNNRISLKNIRESDLMNSDILNRLSGRLSTQLNEALSIENQ